MAHNDTIDRIWAREVLNFRGDPTVEAEVTLADGNCGRALVPSGMSTGVHEAVELLDGDAGRYRGKGVLKAVSHVREIIAPALTGMRASQQAEVDRRMLALDGTPDKRNLGANAILAVSLATAFAAAASQKLPLYRYLGGDGPFVLPVPTFDILSGGKHVQGCVDFQEFHVAPAGFATLRDALHAAFNVYHALGEIFEASGYRVRQGEALAPPLPSNRAAVEALLAAIERAGYRPGEQCYIYIDAATSHLYQDGQYVLAREGRRLTTEEMIELWAQWVTAYPIVGIEDGLAEDDWHGWQSLARRLGHKVQLVGDDFLTTNPERISKAIACGAANGAIIKPNQIGTLSETREATRLLRRAGWAAIMSGRSGETEDTSIADLAVAWGSGQKKFGTPAMTCVLKLNRLLRIDEELGAESHFAGLSAFKTVN